MADDVPKTQLFTSNTEEQLVENILKLDQQLRIMGAQVESKLTNIALYKGTNPEEYKSSLLEVQQEINIALQGISSLVNLATDSEQSKSFFQQDTVDELNEMVLENLEKIAQLKAL